MRLRSGIFIFCCLLWGLEWGRRQLPQWVPPPGVQVALDSLRQNLLDSLKQQQVSRSPVRRVNPNYLSDYQGYRLGLSPGAMDRLQAYRRGGGRIYTSATFRQVTGISDSAYALLQEQLYYPYPPRNRARPPKKRLPVLELNTATEVQLMEVQGIGPVLARRILRFREALGGFMDASQLYDVYGLDPQVAARAIKRFRVGKPPEVHKPSLNTAPVAELARLPYLSWEMAREIVRYRERHGPFLKLSQLQEVPGIPADKIERIGLYLAL